MQRVLVHVPVSQAFVCPECGGPLRAPLGRRSTLRRNALPALRIAVLLGAMAASLGLGYSIGRLQDIARQAAEAAARDAQSRLAVAGGALGLSDSAPALPGPPPVFVAERPYPAKAPSVDVSNPAVRLPREARFGQVTLDCVLEQPAVHAACQVTDIRGADAFSAQAIAWLQSLNVHYASSAKAGHPAELNHRWRMVIEDFSGAPRR